VNALVRWVERKGNRLAAAIDGVEFGASTFRNRAGTKSIASQSRERRFERGQGARPHVEQVDADVEVPACGNGHAVQAPPIQMRRPEHKGTRPIAQSAGAGFRRAGFKESDVEASCTIRAGLNARTAGGTRNVLERRSEQSAEQICSLSRWKMKLVPGGEAEAQRIEFEAGTHQFVTVSGGGDAAPSPPILIDEETRAVRGFVVLNGVIGSALSHVRVEYSRLELTRLAASLARSNDLKLSEELADRQRLKAIVLARVVFAEYAAGLQYGRRITTPSA
jgi:hypothetical protein